MCPLLAPVFQGFFLLLWPLTVLMKYTALISLNYLDVYGGNTSLVNQALDCGAIMTLYSGIQSCRIISFCVCHVNHFHFLEVEETNQSNIREHPYTDICNNAVSVVPWGKKHTKSTDVSKVVFHPLHYLWLSLGSTLRAESDKGLHSGVCPC